MQEGQVSAANSVLDFAGVAILHHHESTFGKHQNVSKFLSRRRPCSFALVNCARDSPLFSLARNTMLELNTQTSVL